MIDAFTMRYPGDEAHRLARVLGLQGDQALGDLGRQVSGFAPVGARLQVGHLETASAIVGDPAAHRLGGEAGPMSGSRGQAGPHDELQTRVSR